MAKCKDCIHFPVCEPHTDPNESYPEVGGCPAFKNKDAFVEVVRCRDCIYAERSEDGDLYCDGPIGIFGTVGFNDFCSYGERREGE